MAQELDHHGRMTGRATLLVRAAEQLRHAALHARAQAFPLGFGVLTGKGVTAWQRALASLAVPQPAPPGPAGVEPLRIEWQDLALAAP